MVQSDYKLEEFATAAQGRVGAKIDAKWVCMKEELADLPGLRAHLKAAVGATDEFIDAYIETAQAIDNGTYSDQAAAIAKFELDLTNSVDMADMKAAVQRLADEIGVIHANIVAYSHGLKSSYYQAK